jgi:hypothetical protein
MEDSFSRHPVMEEQTLPRLPQKSMGRVRWMFGNAASRLFFNPGLRKIR